ncbi:tetratricopeptide repeat protein [Pseudenhygromyxa sp. WMMC2535]|uniref:serine/threonine-protein kinase n=1 Tax=Pseudenhygromyxa sp. WMMC2535 TaxID=2712867 RepID=UPI00155753CE|nr:serine/threonine-protein kinase [Pseudenhygromyxa sp. WMMC2535]NVB40021.1 tetratricopeptide repeat protein [Pseudenhygromyxa sp. WMMC2535]
MPSSADPSSDSRAEASDLEDTLSPTPGFEEAMEATIAGDDTWGGEDEELEDDEFEDEALEDEAQRVARGPARLGRYVLLSKLGEGGMGVVHAAYDPKLERKVAVKLLRVESDLRGRRRLEREAQAQARLAHPNVVRVYEIGEYEGRVFIVMEFVAGQTLAGWLRGAKRGWREIVGVFEAAGRGLAAAHAEGLVHRDFKPENVMLAEDGRVLVMDFGVARADRPATMSEGELAGESEEAQPGPSGLTATGALLGTPAYMAPEQFDARGVDARSDQFSFCVSLWEALYGRRPFSGTSFTELCWAVSSGKLEPPPPSDVPSWLREVVERGLAVSPKRRWPSMDALLEALGEDPSRRRRRWLMLGGLVALVAAVPVGVRVNAAREQAATEQLCGAEAGALDERWNEATREALGQRFAAAKPGFGAEAWAHTSGWMDAFAEDWAAARARSCAEALTGRTQAQAARHAAIDACLDERRASFEGLLAAWERLDGETLALATSAAASLPSPTRCLEDPSEGAAASEVGSWALPDPEQAALRQQLERGWALDFAGRYEAGLELATTLAERAAATGERGLEAEAALLVARFHGRLGDYEAAVDAGERAYLAAVADGGSVIALRVVNELAAVEGRDLSRIERGLYWGELGRMYIERFGLEGSVHEAELLASLGGVYMRASNYEAMREAYARALAIDEAALGEVSLETADMRDALGTALRSLGRYDEALESAIAAKQVREQLLGRSHPEVADSLYNIGLIYSAEERHDEALAAFDESLAGLERTLGPAHPRVAKLLNAQAKVLAGKGDLEAAGAALERALAIDEASLGEDHPDLAGSLNNIGNIHGALGEYEEALAAYHRALKIWEASLEPGHVHLAIAHNNIAVVLHAQGHYEASLRAYERALALREANLGEEHLEVGSTLHNMALVLGELGRYEEAIAAAERSREIFEASLGPEHFRLIWSFEAIANFLREQGEDERALETLRRAQRLCATVPEQCAERMVEVHRSLGELLLERGELEQAEAALAPVVEALASTDARVEAEGRVKAYFVLAKLADAQGEDEARARNWAAAEEAARALEDESSGSLVEDSLHAEHAEHAEQIAAWGRARGLRAPAARGAR